jgi:hypothetical protein
MRILNYNIEYGGFEKNTNYMEYVNIILDNKIDCFVATEPFEPCIEKNKTVNYDMFCENTIGKVVKELNMRQGSINRYYFITTKSKNASIICRYPIELKIDPTTMQEYCIITLNPLYSIKLICIHLVDYPYTFYSLRNIPYDNTPMKFKTKEEIVDLSYSTKAADIERLLTFVKNNLTEKIVIVGDFNEPSHLDDPSNEWKVSKKFEEIGLIDSYRSKNKNFIKDNLGYNIDGATCCFGELLEKEPPSRIDYIYVLNIDVIESSVLNKYKKLSDHLPVLTEINTYYSNYFYKYLKYKHKYMLLSK